MKKSRFGLVRIILIAVLSVVAILALVGFVACSDDETANYDDEIVSSDGTVSDTRQVPVYQGMVISSANSATSYGIQSYSASGSIVDDNVSGDIVGREDLVDENHPFGDDSLSIEQEVEKEFGITGVGQDIYYADKNEDVFVTVKFSNPNDFEILSFRINGQTYASYMFQDGSDMENIIIKLNVGSIAGFNEYEISEIKYVDGTEIKDVLLNGDTVVRCGVRGDEAAVSVSVANESVTLDEISFNAKVTDNYSLIEESDGYAVAVLYDGSEIIASKDLAVGDNAVSFTKLDPNTLYQYAVVVVYDDLSGNGVAASYPYVNSVYTETLVLFDNVVVTKTSVSFEFAWYEGYDDGYLHTKFTLEGGSSRFEEVDPTAREITGLLSDHEYTLNVAYTGIYGETEAIRLTFRTLAMDAPDVEISASTTQVSLSYTVSVTDTDKVGSISSVTVYHGTEVVYTGTDTTGTIDNLLSGNEYEIVVVYAYDMNDGTGTQTMEVSQSISTLAKETPEIEISSLTSTKTDVEYELTVTDTDSVGEITSVALSHAGSSDIEGSLETSGSFDNLLSDNEYTLTVVYTYDLNDGAGPQTIEVSQSISTLAKETPEIEISSLTSTKTGVEYELTVTDTDSVGEITSVTLSHSGSEDMEGEAAQSGSFDNLLSDNEYTLIMVYTYNLNDGAGEQTLVVSKSISTLAMETPEVEISSLTSTKTGVGYELTITDVDETGEITSVTLSHAGSSDIDGSLETFGSFENLLSNNEYTLIVVYTYNLNDGVGSQTLVVSKTISTLAKETPEIEISSLTSTKTDVEYELTVTDTDSVGEITSVALSHAGSFDIEGSLESSGSFGNLLSDNEYTLTIVYTYNLNDGVGEQTLVVSKSISTLAMETPKVEIALTDTSTDELTFCVTLTDADNVGNVTKVELYCDDTLINTVYTYADDMTYSGLSSYTQYTLVVSYSYDLNDGKGKHEKTVEMSAYTDPKIEFISIEVFNTSAVSEGEEIRILVSMDAPSDFVFSSVVINGVIYDVSTISTSSRLYVNIMDDGQFDGGETDLVISQVIGTLDDIEYRIDIAENNVATVFINGELYAESFGVVSVADGMEEERLYRFKNEDLYYKIELMNATGYDIDSVTIGDTQYSSEQITVSEDKQTLYIALPSDSGTGWKNESLSDISYSNETIEKSKSTAFSVSYVRLSTESGEIVEVRTAEDLMNMTGWKYYKLMNDIDLSGDEWINVGNTMQGVFDGNGKRIYNVRGATTVSDTALHLGLFDTVTGVVMNLEVCDVVYMVTLTSTTNTSYNVYAGGLTARSNQMIAVDCIISSSFEITNETGGTTYIGTVSGSGSSNSALYYVVSDIVAEINYGKYSFYGFFGNNVSFEAVDSVCTSSITINDEDTEYFIEDEYRFSYSDGVYSLVEYLGSDTSIVLPETVNNGNAYGICRQAFYRSSIREIVLPDGLLFIGDEAFAFSDIKSIVIPGSVEYIGYCAFERAYNLTEVVIEEGVQVLQTYVFYECLGLKTIVLPSSLESIGSMSFYRCNDLESVYFHGTEEQWISLSGHTDGTLSSTTIYYYSEYEPTENGNYWHYVDGEIVVWNKEN